MTMGGSYLRTFCDALNKLRIKRQQIANSCPVQHAPSDVKLAFSRSCFPHRGKQQTSLQLHQKSKATGLFQERIQVCFFARVVHLRCCAICQEMEGLPRLDVFLPPLREYVCLSKINLPEFASLCDKLVTNWTCGPGCTLPHTNKKVQTLALDTPSSIQNAVNFKTLTLKFSSNFLPVFSSTNRP